MREFNISPDEGVIEEGKEIGNYGPYTQSKREKYIEFVQNIYF